MLETPLRGRFIGEDRKLAFSPTGPYVALVRVVTILGGLMLLNALVGMVPGFTPAWWFLTGSMLLGAGGLAYLCLQSVVFNLQEGTYRRRQGPGLFPTTRHGRLDQLDAVVLIAEPGVQMALKPAVTYHLVLYWKNHAEPLMVLQQETRTYVAGQPLNIGAAGMAQLGLRYAKALRVPFYDNAHIPSKCPVPIWH